MTNADIVRMQIDHQETPRIPHTIGFESGMDTQLDQYFGNTEWRNYLNGFIARTSVLHTFWLQPTGRDGYGRDLYGSIWRTNRRPWHLQTPVLRKPSLAGYRWPKPEEFLADDDETKKSQDFCRELYGGQYLMGNIGWGVFERSWAMCGFNDALMYMIDEPAFYDDLLDGLTEQLISHVDYVCATLPEIDAIMFGDDWGEQRGVIIGPDRWRELIKPRWRRIYDAVHSRGKKTASHCCGSIVDILPDLIEIGLDVIESVQPEARGMNPYELKLRFGEHMCFWGCLGSQSTVPFGTPDEIRVEIKKLKHEMPKGGGYILAPAKNLQPGTPIENAAAVVESFTSPAE